MAHSSAAAEHPAEKGMRTTTIGIAINIVLAIIKILSGVLGHSYALIADGVESATDVFGSIVVYIGLRVSTRPPDDNHPQGHGKAEPLATLTISVFLFLAAALVAVQSVREIFTPHALPLPWTLLVLGAVAIIKETLFRNVQKIGNEVNSTAVKGDAWHHRADAVTSLAAFIGIAIGLLGNKMYPAPWWAASDDWAALFASAVILFNGVTVLRGALYELTDARPEPAIEIEVRAIALKIDGVKNLDKCSVRKMGFDYYVDLDVRVESAMTVAAAHKIAHRVQDVICASAKVARIAKVLVHIEPAED